LRERNFWPRPDALKKQQKLPTSIALEEWTIKELKALAESRGVPYQVLMRMFIIEGLQRSAPSGSNKAGKRRAAPLAQRIRPTTPQEWYRLDT
jgi:hypothetical protein